MSPRLTMVGAVCALVVGLLPSPAAAQREPPDVTAEGAVLWDPADERPLVDIAAEVSRPMASTTKIMTVLLALEASRLDETVTVSERAAGVGRESGVASLGLQPGDRVPLRDLLAGLVLRSGNDAAVAVAEHVAGSEDAFVALMNARASELGLTETQFVNASGLTDELQHHASPVDLARLAVVAMDDPRFAAWAGAELADVGEFGVLENRNELVGSYRGATGVKTGYTALAGMCLVASARRDGRTLYSVVLGSEAYFDDSAALLDYGFAAFRDLRPLTDDELIPYRVGGEAVALRMARPLRRTVPVERRDAVGSRLVLRPSVPLPAPAGTPAGEAQLLVGDRVQARAALVFAEPVEPSAPRSPARAVGSAVRDSLRVLARLRPVAVDVR